MRRSVQVGATSARAWRRHSGCAHVAGSGWPPARLCAAAARRFASRLANRSARTPPWRSRCLCACIAPSSPAPADTTACIRATSRACAARAMNHTLCRRVAWRQQTRVQVGGAHVCTGGRQPSQRAGAAASASAGVAWRRARLPVTKRSSRTITTAKLARSAAACASSARACAASSGSAPPRRARARRSLASAARMAAGARGASVLLVVSWCQCPAGPSCGRDDLASLAGVHGHRRRRPLPERLTVRACRRSACA